MKSKILGLLAVGLLAGPMASAAPVVSFSQAIPDPTSPCGDSGLCTVPDTVTQTRTAWLSGISGATFEEFETAGSRVTGTPALFGGTATLSSNGYQNGFFDQPLIGDSFLGRFNTTSNTTGWWFETAEGVTTIRFSSAVEAFAFYLTDLGDELGFATLGLFNGGQAIAGGDSIGIGSSPLLSGNGSVLFFGVTSDGNPFDSVTLTVWKSATDERDFVGLDSLIIGNVETNSVPEPGTLALLGLGLAGLGLSRRRKAN